MIKHLLFIVFLALCPNLFSQEWSTTIDYGCYWEFWDDISVDNGESVLCVGRMEEKDGLIMKINKDGEYIDRVVHLPGMMLHYQNAVQLDNGNYMVFGICDDSLCEPYFQKYIRVDVFDRELEPVGSKMFDVEDDTFESFANVGQSVLLHSILSPSGTVVLAAAPSYYEEYGHYQRAMQLYELNTEGDVLVKKSHGDAEVSSIREITYEPHSNNLLIALTGGLFPPSYQGSPGIYVVDKDLEIVARQHLHKVQGGWGFEVDAINDITTDGNWIDGDYMILHALKSELNHRTFTYSSLYKVDSALNVYGELRLPPYDSCTWIPNGTSTAYINDSTIFAFTCCAENMYSFDTYQTNVLLVDKHLNLLGRKTISQENVLSFAGKTTTFNDGGCFVLITTRDGSDYQGEPFIYDNLMKFRREDIEITWDVVPASTVVYETEAYPNPANGILNITVDDGFACEARIQIFDLKGMKCLDSMVGKPGRQIRIDLQNLKPGPYIYKLTSSNREMASGKIVKE